MNAQEIIEYYNLKKHPEGGFYKEMYRSNGKILSKNLPSNFQGNRNFCTSIYFLLTSEKLSAFHKINQDEIWYFYAGSSVKIHIISPQGKYTTVIVGQDFREQEHFQYTVLANHYFAAEVVLENSYSFVGCTVSPGFDFRDFNLPSRKSLSEEFPEHSKIIKQFTHH